MFIGNSSALWRESAGSSVLSEIKVRSAKPFQPTFFWNRKRYCPITVDNPSQQQSS
jgi:hypothetical protein